MCWAAFGVALPMHKKESFLGAAQQQDERVFKRLNLVGSCAGVWGSTAKHASESSGNAAY